MKALLAPNSLRPPPANPPGLNVLPHAPQLFPHINMHQPLRQRVREFLNPLFLLLKAAVMSLTPASAQFLTDEWERSIKLVTWDIIPQLTPAFHCLSLWECSVRDNGLVLRGLRRFKICPNPNNTSNSMSWTINTAVFVEYDFWSFQQMVLVPLRLNTKHLLQYPPQQPHQARFKATNANTSFWRRETFGAFLNLSNIRRIGPGAHRRGDPHSIRFRKWLFPLINS